MTLIPDAVHEAQKKGQVSEAVPDDARPRAFRALRNKTERQAGDRHPQGIP